jgi:RNA polymerase sigma-70 factor, ECF subfamily
MKTTFHTDSTASGKVFPMFVSNVIGMDMNPVELYSFTDEQLIEFTRKGATGAFDVIVERYKKNLFEYVALFVDGRDRVQEIVHGVFLRLYHQAMEHRLGSDIPVELFSFARSLLRKEMRRRAFNFGFFGQNPDEDTDGDGGCSPREGSGCMPERSIQESVRSLPVRLREAVVLRDVERIGYDDIASITNSSVRRVKSRVAEARERIRNRMYGFSANAQILTEEMCHE